MMSPFPNALNGFAEATESVLDPPLDIHESFCLDWDEGNKRYQGRADPGPYGIELIIEQLEVEWRWDVYLKIYKGGAFLDQESWHNLYIRMDHLLDTGLIERLFAPEFEGVGWQVAG